LEQNDRTVFIVRWNIIQQRLLTKTLAQTSAMNRMVPIMRLLMKNHGSLKPHLVNNALSDGSELAHRSGNLK